VRVCVSDDGARSQAILLEEKVMKQGHQNPAEQHNRVVLVLVLGPLMLFMHHTQDSGGGRARE